MALCRRCWQTRLPIVRVTAASSTPAAPADEAGGASAVTAAKATFTLKGFAATTMDDIAGAAGMSKKTLYKMFASKSRAVPRDAAAQPAASVRFRRRRNQGLRRSINGQGYRDQAHRRHRASRPTR
jgi:TetR/AcrR family transcriptional repressor of mexJK operon